MTVGAVARMVKFSHSLFALPFAVSRGGAGGRPGPARRRSGSLPGGAGRGGGAHRRHGHEPHRRPPLRRREPAHRAPGSWSPARSRPAAAWALLAGSSLRLRGRGGAASRPLTGWLSLPVLAILLGYSYAKRFTWACHLWLGVAQALGPIGVAIALTGAAPPLGARCSAWAWAPGSPASTSSTRCRTWSSTASPGLRSIPARFGVDGRARLGARAPPPGRRRHPGRRRGWGGRGRPGSSARAHPGGGAARRAPLRGAAAASSARSGSARPSSTSTPSPRWPSRSAPSPGSCSGGADERPGQARRPRSPRRRRGCAGPSCRAADAVGALLSSSGASSGSSDGSGRSSSSPSARSRAAEACERLSISTGLLSMTLAELRAWGAVRNVDRARASGASATRPRPRSGGWCCGSSASRERGALDEALRAFEGALDEVRASLVDARPRRPRRGPLPGPSGSRGWWRTPAARSGLLRDPHRGHLQPAPAPPSVGERPPGRLDRAGRHLDRVDPQRDPLAQAHLAGHDHPGGGRAGPEDGRVAAAPLRLHRRRAPVQDDEVGGRARLAPTPSRAPRSWLARAAPVGQTDSSRNSAPGGGADRRPRRCAASSTASPARSGKRPSVPSATGTSTAAARSRLGRVDAPVAGGAQRHHQHRVGGADRLRLGRGERGHVGDARWSCRGARRRRAAGPATSARAPRTGRDRSRPRPIEAWMPKRAAGSASASRVSRVVAWSPSSPAMPAHHRVAGARARRTPIAARAEARPRSTPPRSLAPWARIARMPTARTARSAASRVSSSAPGSAPLQREHRGRPGPERGERRGRRRAPPRPPGASRSSTGRRNPWRSARGEPG